jgi:hypothetical protein
MATGGVANADLANRIAFTVTDLTAQQPVNIAHDDYPSPVFVAHEIDFDPAVPSSTTPANLVLQAGAMQNYTTAIRPDLGDIPSGETHMLEFKAVLEAPATTAFGPSVLLPQTTTFTFDVPCKNVTVGPNDPSGVGEGTVLQFCDPTSSLHFTVQ